MFQKRTIVEKGGFYFVVSTVKLPDEIEWFDKMLAEGLEKTDSGDDVPVIVDSLRSGLKYETLVFPCTPDGDPVSYRGLDVRRYATQEEALVGHDETVANYKLAS